MTRARSARACSSRVAGLEPASVLGVDLGDLAGGGDVNHFVGLRVDGQGDDGALLGVTAGLHIPGAVSDAHSWNQAVAVRAEDEVEVWEALGQAGYFIDVAWVSAFEPGLVRRQHDDIRLGAMDFRQDAGQHCGCGFNVVLLGFSGQQPVFHVGGGRADDGDVNAVAGEHFPGRQRRAVNKAKVAAEGDVSRLFGQMRELAVAEVEFMIAGNPDVIGEMSEGDDCGFAA